MTHQITSGAPRPHIEPGNRPATLSVDNIGWGPKGAAKPVVSGISFDLAPGQVLGIVGPNGAGKTSLLRMLYRYQRPITGSIRINGDDLWAMAPQAAASRVAAVLQESPGEFGLTVSQIVALGRTPHHRGFSGKASPKDAQIVHDTLSRLALLPLAQAPLSQLSGGERQRVMLARALAQRPQLLILDEPTNHLDIRHQLELLSLIRDLPMTIVTALHDLNAAAAVCDRVLMLQDGRQIGFGSAEAVLNAAAVSGVFSVHARREMLSESRAHHLTFTL